jgi:putative exosortase-associated protein (TIGR04073 family)
MNTLHRALLAGLLTSLSLSTAWADMAYQQKPAYQQSPQALNRTYNDKIARKAVNGLINIPTAPLEIPKSMIKNTNAEGSNIFFGLVGGTIEGSLNAAFRAATGAIDLVTFLVPTKAIVQPQYVWDDFYETRTMYGDVFRLDDNDNEPIFRLPNGR